MEANNGLLVPLGDQHQWWDWTRALFLVTYFCWLQGCSFAWEEHPFGQNDVQEAYRLIPVDCVGRHVLAYIDATLPFGLQSAPMIFSAVTDMLEWILYQEDVSWLAHYTDDTITMGPAKSDECTRNKHIILSVGELLVRKCDGPTSCPVCLGTEVDSEAMELRLPHANLVNLHSLTKEWLGCKACTRHQIKSLIGHLNHNHACIRWSIPVEPSLVDQPA